MLGDLVRVRGLEPPRLAATEPKSVASTSFATPATAHRPGWEHLYEDFRAVKERVGDYARWKALPLGPLAQVC
jgi:hypothetical protein